MIVLVEDTRPKRKEGKKKKKGEKRLSLFFLKDWRLTCRKKNSPPPCLPIILILAFYHWLLCLYRTILFVLSITLNKHICMSPSQQRHHHQLRILSLIVIRTEKKKEYTHKNNNNNNNNNTCQMRKYTIELEKWLRTFWSIRCWQNVIIQ